MDTPPLAALSFEWHESITRISRTEWSSCFRAAGFARSYDYQLAVEAAEPAGVRFAHLMIRDGARLLGIISCFHYELPLGVIATGATRRVIAALDRLRPGLCTLNAFFMGQLSAVCDHGFGLDGLGPRQAAAVLERAQLEVRRRAQKFGCALTMVKELRGEEFRRYGEVLASDYHVVPSLPNTLLEFDASRPYARQIKAKYRNLYNKRRRELAAKGVRWQLVEGEIDMALAREMESMYLEVMGRSDNQFERLPPAYFYELCRGAPGSFALLCYAGDELIAFSINYADEDLLTGLYLGFKPGYDGLYFNVLYQLIDEAERREIGRVQFGQTSYNIKAALGAKPTPLYLAIHAHNRLIHWLIGKLSDELFPDTPFPERHVFAQRPKPERLAGGQG